MKASLWAPPLVFVATAIPVVLLLEAIDVGGDFRVWIAMVAGVAATALARKWLAKRDAQGDDE